MASIEEEPSLAIPTTNDANAKPPPLPQFPSQGSLIRLNVGGTTYITSVATLCTDSDYFNALASPAKNGDAPAAPKPIQNAGGQTEWFLDRDASLFAHLLAWLRDGELPDLADLPGGRELKRRLSREADHFGMQKLTATLRATPTPLPASAAAVQPILDKLLHDVTHRLDMPSTGVVVFGVYSVSGVRYRVHHVGMQSTPAGVADQGLVTVSERTLKEEPDANQVAVALAWTPLLFDASKLGDASKLFAPEAGGVCLYDGFFFAVQHRVDPSEVFKAHLGGATGETADVRLIAGQVESPVELTYTKEGKINVTCTLFDRSKQLGQSADKPPKDAPAA